MTIAFGSAVGRGDLTEVIADHTLADAILDRIVYSAYRINLKGESMRKCLAKIPPTTDSE